MNIKKKLFKIFCFLGYLSRLKNFFWSRILADYGLPYDVVGIRSKTNLYLREFDLEIKPNNFKIILNSYVLLKEVLINKKFNFRIKQYDDTSYIFILDDLSLYITSREEVMIFYEVFYKGIYNFHVNDKVLVLDIGMNVGFTSLFLSRFPNVVGIYSYEPVESTYDLAKNNFKLNSDLSKRIYHHNFGISDCDCSTEIEFIRDFKGSMGIFGIPHYLKGRNDKIEKIEIKLKNINDILEQIITNNDYPLVLKIDCEGAEYKILDSIERNAKFEYIKLLMIEWHIKGPNSIEDLLLRNNFELFSFYPKSNKHGMIYAINNKFH